MQYGLARRRIRLRGKGPLSGILNAIGLSRRKRRVRGRGIFSKGASAVSNVLDLFGLARRKRKRGMRRRKRGGMMMSAVYRRPAVTHMGMGVRRRVRRHRGGFFPGYDAISKIAAPFVSGATRFLKDKAGSLLHHGVIQGANKLAGLLDPASGRALQRIVHTAGQKYLPGLGFARRKRMRGRGRLMQGGAYRTIVW